MNSYRIVENIHENYIHLIKKRKTMNYSKPFTVNINLWLSPFLRENDSGQTPSAVYFACQQYDGGYLSSSVQPIMSE